MRTYLTYLAGPITGCSYEGCTNWRVDFAHALAGYNVHCLSPMRNKNHLSGEGWINDTYDTPLSSAKGIYTRDKFDCCRCDILIVNVLEATRVSIGTMIKIAWADANNIPIILIMENGNVHDHAMVKECCGFQIDTVEKAIRLVKATLDLEKV
jgi:nucleoside 2-deoxyribosyltransferase